MTTVWSKKNYVWPNLFEGMDTLTRHYNVSNLQGLRCKGLYLSATISFSHISQMPIYRARDFCTRFVLRYVFIVKAKNLSLFCNRFCVGPFCGEVEQTDIKTDVKEA